MWLDYDYQYNTQLSLNRKMFYWHHKHTHKWHLFTGTDPDRHSAAIWGHMVSCAVIGWRRFRAGRFTAAVWCVRKRPAVRSRRPARLWAPRSGARGPVRRAPGTTAARWRTGRTTRVCSAERCTVSTNTHAVNAHHTWTLENQTRDVTLTFSRLCMSAGYFMWCSLVAAAMRWIHSCGTDER